MKDRYNTDDCIMALATPHGSSALAVIRMSGDGLVGIVAQSFSNAVLPKAEGQTVHYGMLRDDDGLVLDEVLISLFRQPKSYTGEDSVEISCHGSLPGIRRILDFFETKGIRRAEPGEFTYRAFLNNKLDLTRAEAVHDIVRAKSVQAQSLAMNRLSGAIEERIGIIKDSLMAAASAIELQLDYAEDEIEEVPPPVEALQKAERYINDLTATYNTGKLYQEGAKIALAGRTNSGKSSLFNLFLREDRSIVSEVHGTTRDYLESWVSIDGIPAKLFDTAGLRTSIDPVETEGIRRSRYVIENADLLLYLVDAGAGVSAEDMSFIETWQKKCVPVWSKIDEYEVAAPAGFLPLSSMTGDGFKTLEGMIENRLAAGGLFSGREVVIDNDRQYKLLTQCGVFVTSVLKGIDQNMPLDVLAVDLNEALERLSGITGEITSADILEKIFSGFCVGK